MDKLLSNNNFLETRIELLYDGMFIVGKVLGVYLQCMLEMSRSLYTVLKSRRGYWSIEF